MPLPAQDDETTPKWIGRRYEVLGVLGRGGVGTVYRVRDRYDQRALALKRLALGRGSRPSLSGLFEREYATLSELSHPRIIEVYDYGSDDESLFYTMELLDGSDLASLSPLPYPRVCRYLRDVATSLALIHARKLVHRDVTPRNVLVTRDDQCKLLDFGALVGFGEASVVIGTPPCIAPEALEGGGVDQRADLYALGCLAYFMLTGRHAYGASHIGQLPSYWAQPVQPLSAAKPERDAAGEPLPAIPEKLDELVMLLLRADRSARPHSASAVIDRLNAILGDESQDELGLAERHLASTPLAGRDRELDEASRHLEQLRRGRGSSVLVQGSRGAGKSRLLRRVGLMARLRRACVIQLDAAEHGRAYQGAQAVCRELLRAVPEVAQAVLPRYLSALAPLLPELAPDNDVMPARDEDESLYHSRVQNALRDFVLEIAAREPLVLVIDNLESCERWSAVFLVTLAQEARRHPLCVVASANHEAGTQTGGALDALRAASTVHTLGGLPEPALRGWLESLLGDASNLPRLSQALHARSAGHPGRSLQLLRAMLYAGEIKFQNGTWILPLEPAQGLASSATEDSLRLRVTHLSPAARRLAHAFALYRGALTPDVGRALCSDGDTAMRAQLDELVKTDVLTFNGRLYAFADGGTRAVLETEIEPDERARLRRRIAELLLGRDAPEPAERLEAGLYLLEADDPRATKIVSDVAIDLCTTAQPYAACVEPLERALDVCRAQRRTLSMTSLLLAALSTAAFQVDRNLDRHAGPFLTSFSQLLGLNTARKLRPYLGKHLSTFLGLGWAFLRYRLAPANLRPCSFPTLVEAFMAGAVCLCGKAVVCLDRRSIEDIAHVIEPLTAFGEEHEATFCYDFCRALAMITQERLGETHRLWLDLEARLGRPGALPRLKPAARRLWDGGIQYGLGVFESFAGDPHALERARRLESDPADLNSLSAAQLRRQYHLFRGESGEAARADALIEAYALRTGTAWQAETYSAIVTNYCASLWHDLMTSKRALDETESIAVEVPSLERYALSSKAVYMLARGKPQDCITLYERMLEAEVPRERVGYSASVGIVSEAYNQVGDPTKARELCERTLASAPEGDDKYIHLVLTLHTSLVAALAALGEHDAAEKHIEALIERHKDQPSPFVRGALHESAARLAWKRNDTKAFSQHLKHVEDAFCPLGNPALIARYTALTALGGSEGGVTAKIATMREVRAFEATLEPLHDREQLARHIFAWLMQKCDGFHGYLVVQDAAGLLPLVSSDKTEPPPEALEMVKRSLGSLMQDDEVTTHLPEPQQDTHVERPALRRELKEDASEGLHVHLLSYVENERFHGEGALLLRGPVGKPPRIRYDFLQVAARHLQRVRPRASRPAPPPSAALG